MKKALILFAVLLASVLLISCTPGGLDSSGSGAVSTSSPPDSSGTQSGGEEDPSSLPPSSSTDPNTEYSITGTIDDIAMGKIYLLTDEGLVIPFEYTTADISDWTNSRPGSRITVYYTGVLNGTDTSGIRVTRVVDA